MNGYKTDDIAIIGMSGRFPEADNLKEFWANIVAGRDSVREFPISRLKEIEQIVGDLPAMDLIKAGYLNKITHFEPEIFSISKVESKYLDPQQRLLLELVEEAILDAGYNPESLSGKEIGVFVAANINQYTSNFRDSAMSFTNTVASSNVGRIAYTYNFSGPVVSLDTACSSALIALNFACQSIRSGIIDQAIVGGARLNLFPMEKSVLSSIPVLSPNQKVRAFDEAADGTVLGEGGGIVFIKRLSKALEDGDNIHAVIKGIAVNSDGNRSNGMNAPSEDGQAEVILKAVYDARIDPRTISYIETHGTGTKLGDPIEIAGINSALKKLGLLKNSVAIGSVKSNIGHLDQTAAMAGILKTVLCLKNKVIPPSINFDVPNPLINLIDSYVYVNNNARDWETEEIRRAGVTSLGLIGTNAHVILEEFSGDKWGRCYAAELSINQKQDWGGDQSQKLEKLFCQEKEDKREELNIFLTHDKNCHCHEQKEIDCDWKASLKKTEDICFDISMDKPQIITLSARTDRSLKSMIDNLSSFLKENTDISINNLAYTLNTGRRLFNKRFVTKANSSRDLLANILSGDYDLYQKPKGEEISAIAIFPDFSGIDQEYFLELEKNNPVFKTIYEDSLTKIKDSSVLANPEVDFALKLYVYAKVLESYSIKRKAVLGFGRGEIVADLVRGKLSFDQFLQKISVYTNERIEIKKERLTKAVEAILNAGINLFILIGADDSLVKIYEEILTEKGKLDLRDTSFSTGNYIKGKNSMISTSGNDDTFDKTNSVDNTGNYEKTSNFENANTFSVSSSGMKNLCKIVSFNESQAVFLDNIIDLMKNGLEVDWNYVYKWCKPRRISVPGYSFDRKSYYLKMKKENLPFTNQNGINLQRGEISGIQKGYPISQGKFRKIEVDPSLKPGIISTTHKDHPFNMGESAATQENPLHTIGVKESNRGNNSLTEHTPISSPEEKENGTMVHLLDEETIQKEVVNLIKELSTEDEFDLAMNFLDLNLDSIDLTHLSGQLKKDYNIDVPLSYFFEDHTIEEIVLYITELVQANSRGSCFIQPQPKKDHYPVSSAQKRIYMLKNLQGETTAYNIFGAVIIEGDLDLERLKEVFQILVDRHEAFRTSFDLIDGEVVQRIYDKVNMQINYQSTDESKLLEICGKFVQPFDLKLPPLLRIGLVKYAESSHILMFDMHHIISDGTSMGILIKEFVQLYQGIKLKPLSIQYKDFACWQNELFESDKIKEQEEFWLSQFEGEIPVLNIPTDYQRKVQKSYSGDKIDFVIEKGLTEKISKLSRTTGATLFMILLSAYYILLSRYSSQKDIIIGSPISGRRHVDLENIIGMFVNTLALRNYPEGDKSFKEFLSEVKERAAKAFDNQDYQFEMLVEKLGFARKTNQNPLFDVLFVLQNTADDLEINFENLKFRPYNLRNEDVKFDLNLTAAQIKDKVLFSFKFATDLFKKETIEKMSQHYVNIIREVVNDPEVKLKDIIMLSEWEKDQLLNEFNGTKTDYPEGKTVVEIFEEQASNTPDNVALVYQNKQLTYQNLNQKATHLAMGLRERGVGLEDVVGIIIEPSFEMFIGILAILKVSAAYLPIDPDFPKERIHFMLRDSDTKLVLTSRGIRDKIWGNDGLLDLMSQIVCVEDEIDGGGHDRGCSINHKINGKNLAYIIYTSGTTGQPKGVQLEHQGLVNYIYWFTRQANLTQDDKSILLSSFCFDLSYTAIFPTLTNGGTLHLVSKEVYSDPASILSYLKENPVTYIKTTPSYFNMIVNSPEFSNGGHFNSIRQVVLGGEEINPDDIERFLKNYPETIFINHYGPTEATIGSIFKKITPNELESFKERPVIGKPIDNMQVYILDEYQNLLPIGVPGEIYLAGPGLARGYLNREKITKEKFIPGHFFMGSKQNGSHEAQQTEKENLIYKTGDLGRHLPDGNIEFRGRKDNQVKIRGYRVEVGEIKKILSNHDSISEVAVLVKKNQGGEKYLVAYFVANKPLVIPELRAYMLQKVPSWMIPTYFVQLDAMPLTLNGKIDYKALPDPIDKISTGVKYIPPETELEKKLAAIFSEILGLSKIGINDNFFNIGGNSLSAINMAAKMNEAGLDVTAQDVFEYPTVKELAEKIGSGLNNKNNIGKSLPGVKANGIGKNGNENILRDIPSAPIKELSHQRLEFKNVLLTGVTGYLGIHLLAELIETTTAQIYCLIRGQSDKMVKERFGQLLEFYFNQRYTELIDDRIIVIRGDVTEDRFGLSKADYSSLSREVDNIIHTAALVKHFGQYSQFHDVNVLGTRRMIKLAKESQATLNHISTMSVSGTLAPGDNEIEFTEKDLYIGQNYAENVYVRSKFEAENLILNEQNNGLKASIFRVGNLTGRYQDGQFQKNIGDSRFYNMIKTLIQIGGISKGIAESSREFTPVDLCSKAIVEIMKTKAAANGVFHMYNHNNIKVESVIEACRKLGFEINVLSSEEFNKYVETIKEDKEKFELLARLTAYNQFKVDDKSLVPVRVSSVITQEYLKEIGFEWPILDESYLLKIVSYMREVKFI